MLRQEEELYCGIFDSRILRKGSAKSTDRRVVFYELELFHEESGVSYVDGNRYPVRRGMLLCAKPGQIRHSEFPVRCSFIRIGANAGDDRELQALLASLPECTYLTDPKAVEELLGLFAGLSAHQITSLPPEQNMLRINAELLHILYRIVRLIRETPEDTSKRSVSRITREVYEYINEHYKESCSLEILSKAVNISANHLHTVFTRDMDMTPFAYAMQKRINDAKRLIMAGELTMLQIALEEGFCSQSHFNKVFLQLVGVTPIQYRKQLLEQY
ncbi:MAG: helix-turn-helix transcriptional regulator [Ruminococcaceae bacterium]|nr:helix-turn-helix transcriptional regulator [Oscillospiraceae bacterium]